MKRYFAQQVALLLVIATVIPSALHTAAAKLSTERRLSPTTPEPSASEIARIDLLITYIKKIPNNPTYIEASLAPIRALLFQKVNPNQCGSDGDTPFHVACREFFCLDLIELLFSYQANIHVRNFSGATPLHEACRCLVNNTTLVTRLLTEDEIDVNARDVNGDTPLHIACHYNPSLATVQQLLANRADITARNKLDQTPLVKACSSHNRQFHAASNVINLLLAVDTTATDKTSALIELCKNGTRNRPYGTYGEANRELSEDTFAVVRLLLTAGADAAAAIPFARPSIKAILQSHLKLPIDPVQPQDDDNFILNAIAWFNPWG